MRGYSNLETSHRDADPTDWINAITMGGGVFIEDFLSDAALADISKTIKARASEHLSGSSDRSSFWQGFHGERTTRFTGLGRDTDYFFDLLEDPLFGAVADALLEDSGKGYWLNTCQAMIIGPGEPAQILHRDGDNWANVQSAFWPNSPELTVSMMIALDNVWPALGSTRIVPGSHRWEDYRRRPTPDEVFAGHFKAGDALLYTGSTLHGGGANETADQLRWALHLSVVVGWLTPEEAITQEYPADLVRGRSNRVKRLLGYESFDGAPKSGGRLWLRDFERWRLDEADR